jgi:hypothetical protein
MKKLPKILALALVVGILVAIPASTQILETSSGDGSETTSLPLLILGNRLELSGEQMQTLHDILSGLLDERDAADVLRSDFEDTMIEFSGTSEELDALLETHRADQQAAIEALRESVATALDQGRDLVSINQGLVLRDLLPQLLGVGNAVSIGRASALGSSNGTRSEPTAEVLGSMRSQMQGRLEQLGDRIPDQLEERLAARIEASADDLATTRFGQLREASQAGARMQMTRSALQSRRAGSLGIGAVRGGLFETLGQLLDVLGLKMGAQE